MRIGLWFKHLLRAQYVRTRLTVLAACIAALASVASGCGADYGVSYVGITDTGTLGVRVHANHLFSVDTYDSVDGGLTWKKIDEGDLPLDSEAWARGALEATTPSGDLFVNDVENARIVRERNIFESSRDERRDSSSVRRESDGFVWARETSVSREVVYDYRYLQSAGNRWMQTLDKRNVWYGVLATGPRHLFYDDSSSNLVAAMGLEGVVVVAPDGTSTRVAVGRYSPTDFSFQGKARMFFGSLLQWPLAVSTGLAVLLTVSSSALSLVAPTSSKGPRVCFALSAAISALLALAAGVYPGNPLAGDSPFQGALVVFLIGFGLFPLFLLIGGFVVARTDLTQILSVAAASIGMLALILLGSLVLFETGERTASFVAVGLVGLATLGLWTRTQDNDQPQTCKGGAETAN